MKQLLLSLLLLMGVILSCSKTDRPGENCHRIGQIFEAFPNGGLSSLPFAAIAYDDSGRVVRVTGPGTERRLYRYYKDSISVKTVYETGEVQQHTYLLDHAGRVVRSRSTDYAFRYNADGCLVAFQRHNGKWGQGSAYIHYTVRWENGNPVEVSSTDPDAPVKQLSLTYYSQPHQELAGFNSPLWEGRVLADWDLLYLVPGGHLGQSPRNLLKAADYGLDEQGRIVAMAGRWAFRYGCP